MKTRIFHGWCNLHNTGCIIQVVGHVSWPRAAWLYQEAVTHKKANISVSGGLQIVGIATDPVERTCHRISKSIS